MILFIKRYELNQFDELSECNTDSYLGKYSLKSSLLNKSSGWTIMQSEFIS